MHTPLPEPCSCMNEIGASAGNSCVNVIPLDLGGIDSKSWPGAEIRGWLKLVDDQAGTSARSGVGCAPTTLTAAKPMPADARQQDHRQAQRTSLRIKSSHKTAARNALAKVGRQRSTYGTVEWATLGSPHPGPLPGERENGPPPLDHTHVGVCPITIGKTLIGNLLFP